jgi:quinohemoprotein ethanol dehydrogenase
MSFVASSVTPIKKIFMRKQSVILSLTRGCVALLITLTVSSFCLARESGSTAVAAARPARATATGQRIVEADKEPQNWLATGRNYQETRYSPLTQINDTNAGSLGLVWSYDLDTRRIQEATPLAVDGVIYTTSAWSKVQAFEAATGKLLWQFDPKVPGAAAAKACCDVVNRGAAYWNGKVYVGTIDGRLIAIDARTGKQVWSTQTTDPTRNYTITGAPRVVKGRVLIGNGGADLGVRGYVSAYDAETGKMAWRFYVVPGQPGVKDGAVSDGILDKIAEKTWSGQWWSETGGRGGGTVWDSMAYDPDLDLLYVGTGNSGYWNKKLRSPGDGDNLFVASILALRPETGEYVWHFQEVPGDEWDFTSTAQMILTDLVIDGKPRKVLLHAPKNGVFYILDRQSGRLISAKPYIPIDWARSIDASTGRPDIAPEARYDLTGRMFLGKPDGFGGHDWQPMAFNKTTGLVYLPVQERGSARMGDPAFQPKPFGLNTGLDSTVGYGATIEYRKKNPPKGYLLAWDPVQQKEIWRVPSPTVWNGGVLTTAGNIIVQGDGAGFVQILEAQSGRKLWSFDAQSGIVAAPISFSVNGKQYLTLVTGSPRPANASLAGAAIKGGQMNPVAQPPKGRVLTFALGGTGKLPPSEVLEHYVAVAPEQAAGPETVAVGESAYNRTCVYCHGYKAVSDGDFPDLRHSVAIADNNLWKSIVWDGALEANGMVAFGKNFDLAQVEAIRAFIIGQARAEQGLTP